MMTKFMIVMMIWGGGANGGPSMIQGFETMAACEASAQIVRDRMPLSRYNRIHTVCEQLPTG